MLRPTTGGSDAWFNFMKPLTLSVTLAVEQRWPSFVSLGTCAFSPH
jgi:hypothetical protein